MKVTFLGTSHGVPEPHRRTSCSLLEVGDKHYIIDMGFSAIDDLVTRGIPMESVKGVFITHTHGDHINGIVSFSELISWYYWKCRPTVFLPKMETLENLKQWTAGIGIPLNKDIVYKEIAEGVIYDDGTIRVTAVPTMHYKPSYAFYIEAEGKAVLFTGDIKHPNVDFPEIAKEKHPELIVCEGAHFPGLEGLEALRQCKPQKVCINHYAPWHVPSIMQLAEALKEEFPVVITNDHMEVSI